MRAPRTSATTSNIDSPPTKLGSGGVRSGRSDHPKPTSVLNHFRRADVLPVRIWAPLPPPFQGTGQQTLMGWWRHVSTVTRRPRAIPEEPSSVGAGMRAKNDETDSPSSPLSARWHAQAASAESRPWYLARCRRAIARLADRQGTACRLPGPAEKRRSARYSQHRIVRPASATSC